MATSTLISFVLCLLGFYYFRQTQSNILKYIVYFFPIWLALIWFAGGAIGIVADVIDTDPIEDLAVGWLWALILNFAYGFFAKHNNDVPNEPLQSTEQFEHAETLYQSPQVEFQKEDQRNSLSNNGGRLNLLKIILAVAIGIGILLGALYY